MLHNPNYSFKGISIDAAAKITAIAFANPLEKVTTTVNFYTDQSCQYDIEQKTFTVDTNKQVNDNAVEEALLLLPEFSDFKKV